MLLPKIIAWASEQAEIVQMEGVALDESRVAMAHAVGVASPGKVRILWVREIPRPRDDELANAALHYGVLGPDTLGLTLGYSIMLKQACANVPRVISHELRHVFQYEQAGSLGEFLAEYLRQLAAHGYHDAPLEIDARQCEIDRWLAV